MNYNIRGENIEVTQAIRSHVEEKIGKIEKYFETPPTSDVNVNLSVYNEERQVEVTIQMTDLLLRAEEHHTDMYAITNQSSELLLLLVFLHYRHLSSHSRQMLEAFQNIFQFCQSFPLHDFLLLE